MAEKELRFAVVYCTSFDPPYDKSKLEKREPLGEGWRSKKFSQYPQELILQLERPAKISTLSVLSHESLISRKVEVHLKLVDPELVDQRKTDFVLNPSQSNFTKLGYFCFGSNDSTNFQSREMKTLQVDSVCSYIKLICWHNFKNDQNIFGQVSLAQVKITGDLLMNSLPRNVAVGGKPQMGAEDSQQDSLASVGMDSPTRHSGATPIDPHKQAREKHMDPDIRSRLRLMDDARKRAELNEDYPEAKVLLQAYNNLYQVGAQLLKLEERKIIAVKNLDYDSAELIKMEMDAVKAAVFPRQLREEMDKIYQPQENTQTRIVSASSAGGQRLQSAGVNVLGPGREPSAGARPNNQGYTDKADHRDSQIDEAEFLEELGAPRLNQPYENSRIQSASMAGRQLFDSVDSRRPQPAPRPDDAVIPVLDRNHKKMVIPEFRDEGEKYGDVQRNTGDEYLQAEDIELNKLAFARLLSPFISMAIVKGIFSKNWNYREQAINAIRLQLNSDKSGPNLNFGNEAQLLVAIFGAVSLTIHDKLPQVVQSTLVLLERTLEVLGPEQKAVSSQVFDSYLEEIVVGLILCLGEMKPLTRELAQKLLETMADTPYITTLPVASVLYKPYGLPKKANDYKHVAGRLSVLKHFAMFKQPDVDYQVSRAVELAVKYFESQNAEVRTCANDLIFECFKKVGFDRIEPMLAGVRMNLVEALFRRFNEYLGKDADDNVLANLRERYQDSAKGKLPKAKNEGTTGTKTCDFCSRSDRHFLDSQKYDMHLYRECPMLTNCRGCGMVIEISKLTHHLTSECSSQQKAYSLCEDCALFYQKGEIDEHNKKGNHVTAEEDEGGPHLFCPLCHADIGSGDIAWRRHLIYDGCRNNDRTM